MFDSYKKAPSDKTEMHIPGYNYCGPGTDVEGRVRRGDRGVNELDCACKQHDIEYLMYQGDSNELRKSDQRLMDAADRIIDGINKNSSVTDRVVSFLGAKGIPIGFISNTIKTIVNPQRMAQMVSAKIVKEVFANKKNIENALGFAGFSSAPSAFAKGISSYTDEEAHKIGSELYSYLD